MLQTILDIAELCLAAILVLCILIQSRGAGIGGVFGGEGNVYRTKRGIEKRLFQATIVFAILFFGVALANVII